MGVTLSIEAALRRHIGEVGEAATTSAHAALGGYARPDLARGVCGHLGRYTSARCSIAIMVTASAMR